MSGFMRSLRKGIKRAEKGKSKIYDWANQPASSQDQSPHLDLPPAYSPTERDQQYSVRSHETIEYAQECAADTSPYAFLRDFDTILVVDDSGSMIGSRWHETRETIAAIAPICAEFDDDGVDVYFLNENNWAEPATGGFLRIKTSAAVNELFDRVHPSGRTPVGARLYDILKPYLKRVEDMSKAAPSSRFSGSPVKPINIIVITDGIPTDDVETVVVNAARRLDKCDAKPWQVGIQFVQVGDDPSAKKWLQSLDDILHKRYDIRDIVDTAPWSGAALTSNTILKIMLGGVDKRYDRQAVSKAGGR
ncbi:hypothetical protein BDBG_07505 [Blastomyces gilchristii SLH14081]|uniref:VWFA domain-containing protein n=1 Tax=Blastomyces gilchristii (strain SLH14081) TaxID=559298 RepID=A0A179UVN4_BLAGS|nr:uncharacterized protein BDBG_07505 [Blastomyces gilchristii SLH14081]OAT12114.1 hypothetical protein BDBG_07505 [Blastomyces gilchristii SLH14081]